MKDTIVQGIREFNHNHIQVLTEYGQKFAFKSN